MLHAEDSGDKGTDKYARGWDGFGHGAYAGQVVEIEFLQAVDFLNSFKEGGIAALAEIAEQRTYQRGDVIFTESDPANELFIVRSGRIAVASRSFEGREAIVALMSPGDIFGEMALFDGQGRSTGARALETSTVVMIPFGPVRAQFDADPTALWNVVALLVGRLRATDEALADSVFLDVTGRTAKRLLEIAGDRDEFTIPVTQEELAGMIGASRERVNKSLAQFVRLGWIEQSDRTYRILDRRKLTNRSR